ncbi:efflux RND transporter periplasmic adaptor subunit [uncultured Desulfobulbus sp.]|uniref:efflux RND transporter periplasmic adaptor subunit n=1 Tax=uncultured Desulfobulbus sp. TaxID=239745 RepID=UPI0029C64BF6|nr:efflux RND transporter periplasmic adaptor subunit [uncultured Desulfobulbus sp.]
MKTTDTINLLLMAGVLAGMIVINGCKQQAAPDGPGTSKPNPEVGVVIMATEQVTLTMELSGRISPQMVAEVRPQVGGIIQKRLFTEGSEVKAGEALYQIDPATYQAALASAKATLAKAEANGFTLRQKTERYKQLVAISAVSRQEYDDATAGLKQAEADIEAGKAAVETARINLAYTRITAPIAGKIGRSTVTPGALVIANQATALATIQQLDPIYVDVTQSSADLLRLKRNLASGELKGNDPGQATVKLLLEDGSPYPLEGTLKFSEVTVDQGTGSVTLRALFPNPNQLLLPGMFVRGLVQEGVREQVMLVPQRGVSRDPAGNAIALVASENDVVERRMLKTERTVGDAWLVTEGLKAGERVIVEGLQRVRPGATVKVVPFETKAVAPGSQPAAKQP